MEKKHTQGPWAYGESVDSMWYVEAEGRIIAEVMPGNPGEAEENAQLMAAAPLMLEALRMAFDRDLTYLSDHAEIPRQDVVRARLAIRAALGLQANAVYTTTDKPGPSHNPTQHHGQPE